MPERRRMIVSRKGFSWIILWLAMPKVIREMGSPVILVRAQQLENGCVRLTGLSVMVEVSASLGTLFVLLLAPLDMRIRLMMLTCWIVSTMCPASMFRRLTDSMCETFIKEITRASAAG